MELQYASLGTSKTVKTSKSESALESARQRLLARYRDKLKVNPSLSRALVSYQSNKKSPLYRWYKYKEGFGAEFVEMILRKYAPRGGCVLDPFAGAGTVVTTASRRGWSAIGIELMPVGVLFARARQLSRTVRFNAFDKELKRLEGHDFAKRNGYRFPHVGITQGAFPQKTEQAISAYKAFLESISNQEVRFLFWFALLAVLEDVSFTRKDGQYLRWDHRAQRSRGTFSKGAIPDLQPALSNQLRLMREDIQRAASTEQSPSASGEAQFLEASCLEHLPRLEPNSIDLIITSPPYCNRYDYTRTYALELAFLGYTDQQIKQLRQTLLSATVENKSKEAALAMSYRGQGRRDFFDEAAASFESQAALHEILSALEEARSQGLLNNSNIPCMVRNYFFEMNLVIREMARLLRPGGTVVMVNDNVRYNGEELPVDLILSDFAVEAGLGVEKIWTLPRGKGNSSQQMGRHGRSELRKCVYVWRRPLSFDRFC